MSLVEDVFEWSEEVGKVLMSIRGMKGVDGVLSIDWF